MGRILTQCFIDNIKIGVTVTASRILLRRTTTFKDFLELIFYKTHFFKSQGIHFLRTK